MVNAPAYVEAGGMPHRLRPARLHRGLHLIELLVAVMLIVLGTLAAFALVKYKRLVGGGMLKITNQTVAEALTRLGYDAAEAAAKRAVADADFLDKDGAQLVIERGDVLKAEIERATINALKQLSSRYPVLAETRLLKPVSKSTVPARTKPWSAAEFYQTGHGLYVHDTFIDRLNLSISQIGDSTLERPYIASLLKVNAYDKDIREELPKTHLSTLEDIA